MFEKSVLKLRPTVVKDQNGGDPSPYVVGLLKKGEIFARWGETVLEYLPVQTVLYLFLFFDYDR